MLEAREGGGGGWGLIVFFHSLGSLFIYDSSCMTRDMQRPQEQHSAIMCWCLCLAKADYPLVC